MFITLIRHTVNLPNKVVECIPNFLSQTYRYGSKFNMKINTELILNFNIPREISQR